MFDPANLPSGVRNTLDGAAVVTITGAVLQVIPAITAVLVFVWTIFRLLDTRVTKALLFKWFGFDLESWLSVNRAGKPDDE